MPISFNIINTSKQFNEFMPKSLGQKIDASSVEIQELKPEECNAVAGAPQVKNDPD